MNGNGALAACTSWNVVVFLVYNCWKETRFDGQSLDVRVYIRTRSSIEISPSAIILRFRSPLHRL